MTKADIIKQISSKTGIEKETVSAVFESTMTVMKNSLTAKEPIFLRGFGTFLIKERKTKIARNIKDNTSIVVPAHPVPFFKPCKEFKKAVEKDN